MRSPLWFVVAGLIALAGFAGALFYLVPRLGAADSAMIRVVVPGTAVLTLDKAGRYTIYHEKKSTVDGRYYASETVNGLRLRHQRDLVLRLLLRLLCLGLLLRRLLRLLLELLQPRARHFAVDRAGMALDEGLQHRPDRRDRRVRAAGHRLTESRAGTRSVPRAAARGTDRSGERRYIP